MAKLRKTVLRLTAMALLVSLLPVSAQDIEKAAGAAISNDPLVYLFHADALGHPTGSVSARFEYRSGHRVLGTSKLLLGFNDAKVLRVRIPSSIWHFSVEPDLRMLVFADDLLLQEFDLESLVAYNRVLAYTHPAERLTVGLGVEKIYCQSPCDGGCGPFDDFDCDGVNNITDNCTDDPNSNQADCDNDGFGDVCDGLNATYQNSGPVNTCMTDKDDHLFYKVFEHHVEQRRVDVSSCNAPDAWNRWVREDNTCFNISDSDCCHGLRFSISAVGDSPTFWCGSSIRNVDFCH